MAAAVNSGVQFEATSHEHSFDQGTTTLMGAALRVAPLRLTPDGQRSLIKAVVDETGSAPDQRGDQLDNRVEEMTIDISHEAYAFRRRVPVHLRGFGRLHKALFPKTRIRVPLRCDSGQRTRPRF